MDKTALLHQFTAQPLEKPCDASWDEMTGDARVRHCAQCSREVLHVSAMSAREAEIRLLNSPDAVPCIRYARNDSGEVVHRPEPRIAAQSLLRARSALAATTLGATLAAAPAFAEDDAPAGCVAFEQPAPSDQALARREVNSPEDAREAKPAAKVAAKSSAARSKSVAYGMESAPAKAEAAPEPQPAAPGPAKPAPRELGGKVAAPRERPAYGTLILKSRVNREVKLIGIALSAPLSSYLLTPGKFVAEVKDPSGKVRRVPFTIENNQQTVVDLDLK